MKNKIVIFISLIIVVSIMASVLIFMKTDKPTINLTDDEVKFKEEYESLNGTSYKEDYILKNVDIESDNNIKYVSDSEILSLLEEGTNIIYFGWADCNWCRSIVPTLIKTIKENEIETIYYYDFKSLRNAYENNSDKEKVEIYEKIIDIIGEDIESVFAEESERKGEKKVLAPTVIFIKNGKFNGLHVKSVDSQEKSTDDLAEKELEELKKIYQNYIDETFLNVCYEEGC